MVKLRPIAVTDAAAIAAAVARSRDALRRWMPWYRDDYDIHTARTWIEHSLASTAAGTAIQFAISETDDNLVGVIGLEGLSEGSGRAMIGYWLATQATGRGIGRRAIELTVDWARTQPAIRVVWAIVADANVSSRRVLELNQFELVGSRGRDERGDIALLYELPLRL